MRKDLQAARDYVLDMFSNSPIHQTKLNLILSNDFVVNVGVSSWDDTGIRRNVEIYRSGNLALPMQYIMNVIGNMEMYVMAERPESMLWLATKVQDGYEFITYTKFVGSQLGYTVFPLRAL